MPRAIERLRETPSSEYERRRDIKEFMHILLLTLTFAPDRKGAKAFTKLRDFDDSFINVSAEILKELEKEFFDELYIDRVERLEVEGYVPSQRLTLVHGLAGTGKTVILMKICQNLNRHKSIHCEYFDFKAIVEALEIEKGKEFGTNLKLYVFDRLKRIFISKTENEPEKWTSFKIENDPGYSHFRELVLDLVQKPLHGLDWAKSLDDPELRQVYMTLEHEGSLTTLLSFLKSKTSLVLCFDNIDRLDIRDQRTILELSIHLSNEVEIPIILAIRTPNLRRVSRPGAKGDVVYTGNFDPPDPKLVRMTNLESLLGRESIDLEAASSLKRLLVKRFDFMNKNRALGELSNFYQNLYSKVKNDLSREEYALQFQSIFDEISNTFIYEDAYSFCNLNIREILLLYFEFINQLMIHPDPLYSLETLIPRTGKVRKTILRNYFYKWIISNGNYVPSVELTRNNIYEKDLAGNRFIIYKILSFLYNLKAWEDGVKIGTMIEEFWRFGIDRALIIEAVLSLGSNQEFNAKTLLWIDSYPEEEIFIDDAKVLIMPSGIYFIEKLSISREYCFWMALLTDLETDEVDFLIGSSNLRYRDTAVDRFKLNTVYNFVERVLIPNLELEMQEYARILYPPSRWKGSNFDYFRQTFSFRGQIYQERLLSSIDKTIDFSNLDSEEKNEFHLRNKRLMAQVRRIKEQYSEENVLGK